MSVDRILALKLITDVGGINKQMKGVQGGFKGLTSSAKSWGTALATDVALQGIGAVSDAIGDAWAGFRSGQKVAAQLGVTWRNLGLDGKALDGVLKQVTDSTLALGTSDDEAVQVFNNSLQRTHDYHESLKRLTIAQDLVANGSAPDLASAMKLVDGAAKGSAKVVDKFGLTSKTAGGRVAELGRKVKGAAKEAADLNLLKRIMNKVNEDLEGIVGSFATGDITGGFAAMVQLGKDLTEAWGTVFDKIAPVLDRFTGGSFTDISTSVGDLSTKLGELATNIGAKVGPMIGSMIKVLQGLQPILQGVQDATRPLIDLYNTALAGSLGFMIDLTTTELTILADLLRGDFSGAWRHIEDVVRNVANVVGNVVSGMINTIVSAWNSLDFGIPAGTFQFWGASDQLAGTPLAFHVPAFGLSWHGTGDLIPDIVRGGGGVSGRGKHRGPGGNGSGFADASHHAAGTDFARAGWSWVGEQGREMVRLPRGAQVLSHPESMAMAGGRGGGHRTYNVTVVAPVGADKAAIGREVVSVIKAYERRDGALWRH